MQIVMRKEVGKGYKNMAKPASLHAIKRQFGELQNANKLHKESLSFQDRLALRITTSIGTMYCVYVFAGIGVGSLVGVLTGNLFLATLFGAFSSYFLQLVFLPLLQLGQNIQARHSEIRAESDYQTNLKSHAILETLLQHAEQQAKLFEELKSRPIA